MSRGPGRWQRAILEALQAHDDVSLWHIFPDGYGRRQGSDELGHSLREEAARAAQIPADEFAHRELEADRANMARTFWLFVTFDTDGGVFFVEEKRADRPALRGHPALPLCSYPTSPSVSLLVNTR